MKVELARVALVREDASSIAKLYGYRLHMSIRMHQYVGSLPGKVFELAFPFPLFFSFLLFFFLMSRWDNSLDFSFSVFVLEGEVLLCCPTQII